MDYINNDLNELDELAELEVFLKQCRINFIKINDKNKYTQYDQVDNITEKLYEIVYLPREILKIIAEYTSNIGSARIRVKDNYDVLIIQEDIVIKINIYCTNQSDWIYIYFHQKRKIIDAYEYIINNNDYMDIIDKEKITIARDRIMLRLADIPVFIKILKNIPQPDHIFINTDFNRSDTRTELEQIIYKTLPYKSEKVNEWINQHKYLENNKYLVCTDIYAMRAAITILNEQEIKRILEQLENMEIILNKIEYVEKLLNENSD